MLKLTKCVVFAGSVQLLTCGIQLQGQTYHLQDLGVFLSGTNSYAHSINNAGQVAGYWDTLSDGIHGFVYANGAMTDLGLLGGTNLFALAINADGEVTGFAESTNGAAAFLYSGTLTSLGALGGANSYGLAIASGPKIAGYIDTTNATSRAILYQGGNTTDLGTLGGLNSFAYGINGSTHIVGASLTGGAATNAFIWVGGSLTNLNELIATNAGWILTEARAINAGGRIAGWGITNSEERAFLYADGLVSDVGILPGGNNSYALALNNSNVVAGASSTGGGLAAVRWKNGTLEDLNDLIPGTSGWELKEARGINDQGQIVGWGVTNSQEHAFLLTPNVPPAVSITSPADSALFLEPGDITITAAASDPDGTVTEVEFFVEGVSIGISSTPPYQIVWHNTTGGAYELTAVATDDFNESNTSAGVDIVVNSLPIISITSPSNNAVISGPTNITISATASDDGTVAKVEFYQDNVKLGEVTSSPYDFVWTNTPLGSFTLTAEATDNLGMKGISSPVDISVQSGGETAPAAPSSLLAEAVSSSQASLHNDEFDKELDRFAAKLSKASPLC